MKPTKTSRGAAAPHPSDSTEQRRAEFKILKKVEKALNLRDSLVPEELTLGDAAVLADGVSRENGKVKVLVEVYAHQGSMKGGQPHKLMSDAIKLSALRMRLKPRPHAVLAVSPEVERQLAESWRKEALAAHDVQVIGVKLSPHEVEELKKTQRKQFR